MVSNDAVCMFGAVCISIHENYSYRPSRVFCVWMFDGFFMRNVKVRAIQVIA